MKPACPFPDRKLRRRRDLRHLRSELSRVGWTTRPLVEIWRRRSGLFSIWTPLLRSKTSKCIRLVHPRRVEPEPTTRIAG